MSEPLAPCRFCGETEKLSIDEGAWETTWAIDGEGRVIRDDEGQPTSEDDERFRDHHHIDQVCCQTCETMASVRVWNSTPEFMVTMLANIAAADAEYDDDGVWQGQGLEISI